MNEFKPQPCISCNAPCEPPFDISIMGGRGSPPVTGPVCVQCKDEVDNDEPILDMSGPPDEE